MASNKKLEKVGSAQRIKTLENVYACNRDYDIDYPLSKKRQIQYKESRTSKLYNIIHQKLTESPQSPTRNIINLQPLNKNEFKHNLVTLQPIKEAQYRIKKESPQEISNSDNKRQILKLFLENNQFLLDSWKNRQIQEKQKFKNKMKLAAIRHHKSTQKLPSKQILKQSLKSFNKKSNQLESPKKPSKIASLKMNNSQGMMMGKQYKNYINNMIEVMEQTKKELTKVKKEIRKKLSSKQKQVQILSRKKLIEQIQEQLIRQDSQRKEEKLQKYRRQLEEQLEREIFFENGSQLNLHKSNNPASELPSKELKSKVDDPQKSASRITKQRSKSLAEQQSTEANNLKQEIEPLSEAEQRRCIKIIENYKIQ